MEEENRAPVPIFRLLFHEIATKTDALSPVWHGLSIRTWRALSHPSPEPKLLTGFAIFSQLSYLNPVDLYLVSPGTWSQTFVPIRRAIFGLEV